MSTAVGIDLGTTYSCVGVYRDGSVEIVSNSRQELTTPSLVCYLEDGTVHVGEEAERDLITRPDRTIRGVKRLMGKRYSELDLEESQCDPKILPGPEDSVLIEIPGSGSDAKKLTPVQVSAEIVKHMKQMAEKALGEKVTNAVVTLPAYFNEAQRSATHAAVRMAGLEPLLLLNEPTAAAMTYSLEPALSAAREVVLIFDFGGGTLDVTVLTRCGTSLTVHAHDGDTHAGGEDIDEMLMNYCLQEFKRQNPGVPLNEGTSEYTYNRLRRVCQHVKCQLSNEKERMINVENFAEGHALHVKVTRSDLERLCERLFGRVMYIVKDCLTKAGKSAAEVEEVVLVGGSSRIPKVRSLVGTLFPTLRLKDDVDPDTAVAYGAALKAAQEIGVDVDREVLVQDVLAIPMGMESRGGILSVIAPTGTRIPCKLSSVYETVVDNQKEMRIRICEGERPMVQHCHRLGEFLVTGLKPALKGQTKVEVTLDFDASSMLVVTAEERNGVSGNRLLVDRLQCGMPYEQAMRQKGDRMQWQREDEELLQNAKARNRLEDVVYDLDKKIDGAVGTLEGTAVTELKGYIEEERKWISDHKMASACECEARTSALKARHALFR